jgi:hypothetical protein
MSNKTRLQTNNTNLQALIDKANALPDAGGSSIETCEVVLHDDTFSVTWYYTDAEMSIKTFKGVHTEITVAKNTTVTGVGTGAGTGAVYGEAMQIYSSPGIVVLHANSNFQYYIYSPT